VTSLGFASRAELNSYSDEFRAELRRSSARIGSRPCLGWGASAVDAAAGAVLAGAGSAVAAGISEGAGSAIVVGDGAGIGSTTIPIGLGSLLRLVQEQFILGPVHGLC
jgi:hypothetical protein